MKKNKITSICILTTLTCLIPSHALSAGFQTYEYSGTGLGRAFAGEAALADNAGTQLRNPAMLTFLSGTQVSGGLIYKSPNIDVEGITHTNEGEYITSSSKDLMASSLIPNMSVSHQINEKFYLGLSLAPSFGVDNRLHPHFKGIQFGNEAKIETLEINPNFAYQINDAFSMGLGVRLIHAKASMGSKSSGGLSPVGTNLKHFQGDDYSIGWQLGSAWQINEKHRMGFNLRSGANFSLEGNATGAAFGGAHSLPGNMNLNLPATSEISTFHQLDKKTAIHTSLNWTDWSAFKKSEAQIPSLTPSSHVIHEEAWMSSYRIALGATHQYDKKIKLRTGIAYDLSAANDSNRSMILPESDQIWFSLGAGYAHSKNLTLDAGLTYIYLDEAKITAPQACLGSDPDAIHHGGSFTGHTTGNIWLFGVQASYRF